jgi:hypothetical protein
MVAKVVELIDVQNYYGQEILNRYHFVDEDGVADEATLVSDYVTDVLPQMLGLQTADLSHTEIRHRQVYPTAELTVAYTTGFPIPGTASGADDLPSFFAGSIKSQPGPTVVLAGGFTGHIKRSGIRVAGILENMVNSQGFVSSQVTQYAVWLAELQDPGTDPWLLCVASYLNGARVRQPTVQSYAKIIGFSAPSPSTQNTRKLLRGRAS